MWHRQGRSWTAGALAAQQLAESEQRKSGCGDPAAAFTIDISRRKITDEGWAMLIEAEMAPIPVAHDDA
jgi:hypothetical protein